MTSRIAVLTVDARDPARVAEFWCQVLGWVVHDRDADGVVTIAPVGARPGADVMAIDLVPVPEPKTGRTACTWTFAPTESAATRS